MLVQRGLARPGERGTGTLLAVWCLLAIRRTGPAVRSRLLAGCVRLAHDLQLAQLGRLAWSSGLARRPRLILRPEQAWCPGRPQYPRLTLRHGLALCP